MSTKKIDLKEQTRAHELVLKLQNLFRKELALQGIEDKMEVQKQKLAARAASDFPEGEALNDFCTQLKAKRISPEAFFRMCDSGYKKEISYEAFRFGINKLGLKLSKTQLMRLEYVVDEDSSKKITLEEFQNALEAFEASVEEHILTNEDGTPHKPFQLQALEKYFTLLKKRQMTQEELFNSASEDPNAQLTLDQFRVFVMKIAPSLNVKELNMLKTFYDVNRDGLITKQEFVQAGQRGEKAIQIRKRQEEAGEFDADTLENAGQAVLEGTMNSTTSKAMTSAEDSKAKIVIQTMEKSGMPFCVFTQYIKNRATNGKVPQNEYLRASNCAYKGMKEADQRYIMSQLLSANKKDITIQKIETLNQNYAQQNKRVTPAQNLKFIANSMVEWVRGKTNKPDFDAGNALDFGWKKLLKMKKLSSDDLTKQQASDVLKDFSVGSQSDLDLIFKSMSTWNSKTVSAEEIHEKLHAHATGTAPPIRPPPVTLDSTIPNYDKMTPRSKTESAISYIKTEFKNRKIDPISAYRMADPTKTNKVNPDALVRAFMKLHPDLNTTVVNQAITHFGNKSANITQADFELAFEVQAKTKSTRPQTAKPSSGSAPDSINASVRKMDQIMLQEGIAPMAVFKKADINNDGVIVFGELKQMFTHYLKDTPLASKDIMAAMKAFDVNKNGKIDQKEFLEVFSQARATLPAQDDDGSDFGDEVEIRDAVTFKESNTKKIEVAKAPIAAKTVSISKTKTEPAAKKEPVKVPAKKEAEKVVIKEDVSEAGGDFDMEDEVEEGDQMIPEMMTEQQKKTGLTGEDLKNFDAKLEAAVGKIIIDNPTEADAERICNLVCNIERTDGRIYDMITKNDIKISSSKINNIFKNLISVQVRLKTGQDVKSLLNKLDKWSDSLDGDNYEARENIFFSAFQKAQLKHNVTDTNILMLNPILMKVPEFGDKDPNYKEALPTPLTDWEILAAQILFINLDELNSLTLDKTFLLSSNRDLDDSNEDDKQEKEEFLNECVKRVLRALSIMKLCVGFNEMSVQSGAGEINIMDDSVYIRVRFARVANSLRNKLQTPQDKKRMVQQFKACLKDRMTYFEFFSMLDREFGMNFQKTESLGAKKDVQLSQKEMNERKQRKVEWVKDGFADFLDDYGEAHIGLNDLIDFLGFFDFDLGVQKTVDEEERLKLKANIEPKDYKLKNEDYWRGCNTILNNETAALLKCEQIFQTIPEGGKWLDTDFGPKTEDPTKDETGSREALYFEPQNGTKIMPSFDQTTWMRPDKFAEGQDPSFFKGDASSNDVRQGAIGDCWFIGALSVLATRDELIVGAGSSPMIKENMMIDKQIASYFSLGVFPPIFHKYASRGIYVMRFFKEFRWRYVLIDDRIPCYAGNGKPMFGYCKDLSELWVPLIEKGYAKLFGCYQTLVSGFIDDGLMDLTSMVCEKKKLHDKNGFFDESQKVEFWNFLDDMKENKSLMGCSASGATEREIQIDGERTGILTGHAYGLLDVINLQIPKEGTSKSLLRVRNPWGKCEWNGPWSDYSEEIEEYKAELEYYVNQLPEDEQFNLQEEDGTFLIDYKNFRDIYNKIFIALDFPDKWCGIRFQSEWTKDTCGGLPLKNTEAEKKRFAKNPQYLFAPTKDTTVFMSFTQPDGRVQNTDGSYSTFPYKDRINMAMLLVMKLEPDEDMIETYDRSKVKFMEKPAVLHELSLRMNMKAGEKWVIVCSPKMHTATGRFELSLYFDTKLFSNDIRRLNGPREQYTFIAEEYEKNVNKLPAWKEDLCRASIPYVIGQPKVDASIQRKNTLGSTLKKGEAKATVGNNMRKSLLKKQKTLK